MFINRIHLLYSYSAGELFPFPSIHPFFLCFFSALYIHFVATATCCWIYFSNFRFADIPALLIHVRLRFAAVTNTQTSVLCVSAG